MIDNGGDRRGPRGRSRRGRARLLAAAAPAVAVQVAACGGGSPAAAPRTSTGGKTAQKMDAFAQCVRDHGVAGFYISRSKVRSAADYKGPGLYLGNGWVSTPISLGPVAQSALKACNHLLGSHGNPTATSAQLRSMVKAAACMRTHGYTDYPDPTKQNGQITEPPLPTSINTDSPQFKSASEACNASG